MIVRFHPAAQDELIATALYYEEASAGLGTRFRNAVHGALEQMRDNPEIGAPRGGARRMVVRGYPYDIVYRATPATLEVLAVAHHRRRPGYWRNRS